MPVSRSSGAAPTVMVADAEVPPTGWVVVRLPGPVIASEAPAVPVLPQARLGPVLPRSAGGSRDRAGAAARLAEAARAFLASHSRIRSGQARRAGSPAPARIPEADLVPVGWTGRVPPAALPEEPGPVRVEDQASASARSALPIDLARFRARTGWRRREWQQFWIAALVGTFVFGGGAYAVQEALKPRVIVVSPPATDHTVIT